MNLNRLQKFFYFWLPALAWAGLIFYLSGQAGLRVGFSTPNEVLARKIAHVAEYGVLAWLAWRVLYFGFELKVKKSVLFAIILTTLYAASDEWHQMFVMDRKGKLADVAVDVLGGLLAIQVVVPLYLRKIQFKMVLSAATTLLLLASLVGLMVLQAQQAEQERILNESSFQSKDNQVSGENRQAQNASNQTEEQERQLPENQEKKIQNEPSQDNAAGLPKRILLDVPFTSQAPFANWDDVHEEACEEASLIMMRFFLLGKKLTPETAEQEIQKMKEFQLAANGHYVDSNMEELVQIAQGFYGIDNLEVVYGFSREQLKHELAKGNPVIVPTAGRELGNPFFTHPGPLYHNLVLVGYEGNTIITNDPGTRRGEKYEYDIDVLYDAIHDFPGSKDRITQGPKAMIVVR